MNLVADESLEKEVVAALRFAQHIVFSISEEAPGVDDTEVLRISADRAETLVTNDKDFGDLVFQARLPSVGVILLRLAGLTPDERADLLVNWLEIHGETYARSFVVITQDSFRVRELGDNLLA